MGLYIEQDIFGFDLANALRQLPSWRREKALSYRFERDQRLCVLAYRLLCTALEKEFAITESPRFAYGENGKPHLPDYPFVHFNLSHCPVAVACAISKHPVGVDVEEIKPFTQGVLDAAFSSSERERILSSVSPETEFAVLWTQKESLIKLRGDALDSATLPMLLTRLNAHTNSNSFSTSRFPGFVISQCV